MKRFIEGEDRTQVTLLPACLDDYVEAENPVRVVEVFVDGLDLDALGFVGVDPAATGPRPRGDPCAFGALYRNLFISCSWTYLAWSIQSAWRESINAPHLPLLA
jgi:hypothetical protein